MTDWENLFKQLVVLATAACCLLCFCGCLAQRGIDFGHWAQAGERIPVIRLATSKANPELTGNESLLILPPTGPMSDDLLRDLHDDLCQEMRNYTSAEVVSASRNGVLRDYLTEDNILLTRDMPNRTEVARIGRLVGATHVLCTRVREFRAYPPQVLSLCLVLVATDSSNPVAELDAGFDAADQQVVIALGRYLQRRRARKYDSQNLDIMLRSPSEYRSFVSAECSRALAGALWNNAPLKKAPGPADSRKGS